MQENPSLDFKKKSEGYFEVNNYGLSTRKG